MYVFYLYTLQFSLARLQVLSSHILDSTDQDLVMKGVFILIFCRWEAAEGDLTGEQNGLMCPYQNVGSMRTRTLSSAGFPAPRTVPGT